jgi:hypothetical protein
MALLEIVKTRIGVYYSDVNKDTEIQSIIDGAILYFKGAGWNINPSAPTSLEIEAITLYVKMAQSTDPQLLTNHPVLISFIAQSRCKQDEI